MGRRAAYLRTGDAQHQCTIIAVVDDMLARANLPQRLAGFALLVLTRARASSRLALAPWWLSSGAGLTASLRLP